MTYETIDSKGLMRHGHFTSSKRAVELDEPIYPNLFTVTINPDDMPAGLNYSAADVNIWLEGLRSITGLDTQPGIEKVSQKYKFAERGFAGAAPQKTHLDIVMTFDLNLKRNEDGTDDNYTYKFLRKWSDLIYDPQTGRMSIKKNYICKALTVTMQDKEGVPYHQWIIRNIFPTSQVPSIQPNYETNDIWKGF